MKEAFGESKGSVGIKPFLPVVICCALAVCMLWLLKTQNTYFIMVAGYGLSCLSVLVICKIFMKIGFGSAYEF